MHTSTNVVVMSAELHIIAQLLTIHSCRIWSVAVSLARKLFGFSSFFNLTACHPKPKNVLACIAKAYDFASSNALLLQESISVLSIKWETKKGTQVGKCFEAPTGDSYIWKHYLICFKILLVEVKNKRCSIILCSHQRNGHSSKRV